MKIISIIILPLLFSQFLSNKNLCSSQKLKGNHIFETNKYLSHQGKHITYKLHLSMTKELYEQKDAIEFTDNLCDTNINKTNTEKIKYSFLLSLAPEYNCKELLNINNKCNWNWNWNSRRVREIFQAEIEFYKHINISDTVAIKFSFEEPKKPKKIIFNCGKQRYIFSQQIHNTPKKVKKNHIASRSIRDAAILLVFFLFHYSLLV